AEESVDYQQAPETSYARPPKTYNHDQAHHFAPGSSKSKTRPDTYPSGVSTPEDEPDIPVGESLRGDRITR
ncbi:MAG: hypothetical protein M1833_000377, partial [Piccolia ochrophora]